MYFAIVFGTLILVAVGAIFYLWTRVHKFSYFQKLAEDNKRKSWLLAFLPILILFLFCLWNVAATVVVFLHVFVIWLLSDFAAWIIRKVTKKQWTRYWQGGVAIAAAVLYLCSAWYLAHHVYETDYTVTSEKKVGTDSLRIAQIADSHVGATFDGAGFAKHMETVQKTKPDVLVITGDFVDDDTKKADMVKACASLGKFQTKYGVYFVYGNHDKGYFEYRDFTTEELAKELEKNHVQILEDESVELVDGITLLGRQDKSKPDRATMHELSSSFNPDNYIIVLDHQPSDYDAEAKAGVDLVLSGHTHGGWFFPANIFNRYFGPDDLVYGREERGDTTFLVTSGISDWALPFKTGTISEFVVVDVEF